MDLLSTADQEREAQLQQIREHAAAVRGMEHKGTAHPAILFLEQPNGTIYNRVLVLTHEDRTQLLSPETTTTVHSESGKTLGLYREPRAIQDGSGNFVYELHGVGQKSGQSTLREIVSPEEFYLRSIQSILPASFKQENTLESLLLQETEKLGPELKKLVLLLMKLQTSLYKSNFCFGFVPLYNNSPLGIEKKIFIETGLFITSCPPEWKQSGKYISQTSQDYAIVSDSNSEPMMMEDVFRALANTKINVVTIQRYLSSFFDHCLFSKTLNPQHTDEIRELLLSLSTSERSTFRNALAPIYHGHWDTIFQPTAQENS
jgi:hypothetical protein